MAKIKQENLIDEKNINLKTLANNCIYSSEEKIIGKWFDKTHYQKTIYANIPSASNEGAREIQIGSALNIDNIEFFTDIRGTVRYVSSDNKYRQFSIYRTHYTNINYQVGVYLTGVGNNTNDIRIEIGGAYWDKNMNVYITLEYTKIID